MPYAHVREMVVQRDGELHVDGLPLRAGDRVEVFVIARNEAKPGKSPYPLHGTPVRYDDPFAPAIDPEEWEANR